MDYKVCDVYAWLKPSFNHLNDVVSILLRLHATHNRTLVRRAEHVFSMLIAAYLVKKIVASDAVASLFKAKTKGSSTMDANTSASLVFNSTRSSARKSQAENDVRKDNCSNIMKQLLSLYYYIKCELVFIIDFL